MPATFTERTATRRRAELMEAAAELVGERGWVGLRMQPIAERVGVSRQTVYNEFGDKEGIVAAMALHVADKLLDHAEAAIAGAGTLLEAWDAALRVALELADQDPVMAAAVKGPDDHGFIRHFIGEPLIMQRAQQRIAAAFHARWPSADATRLDIAIEAAIRLTISHALLPLHPPADVAAQTALLLAAGVAEGPGLA